MFALGAVAQCSLTNPGLTPFPDMGIGYYKGFRGGLYPGGVNNSPPSHFAAAMIIATNGIKPLDVNGNASPATGKIVLLSIGMSNTTHEWASGSKDDGGTDHTFQSRVNADPSKNPQVTVVTVVTVVDGAQGGPDTSPISWWTP